MFHGDYYYYYYYYDLDEATKSDLLDKRKEILTLVLQQIDAVLNPSKPSFDSTLTEEHIFNLAGINKEAYYSALSISPDSNYELHPKMPVDSWFIHNYFVASINGFAANVNLQLVFNHNKCVTYVCSYFTKNAGDILPAMSDKKKNQNETINITTNATNNR